MSSNTQPAKPVRGKKAPPPPDHPGNHPLRGVLSGRYQPAFNATPRDILEATSQQFSDRYLIYREWAQNSQDAGARQVRCEFRMEDAAPDGFTFVAVWTDNGGGMSRAVVEQAYLRIFSSTKEETRNETVGYFSLGRLIVFAFVPELISQETVTLPEQPEEPATLIRLFPDGTGEVYELARDEAVARLGQTAPRHGTQVTLRYRVAGGEREFAAEVEKSVTCMRKECRWIRPRLTVTTARYEPAAAEGQRGTLAWGSELVNQSFGVPGRLSKRYPFELASGLGKGVVSVGIRPDGKDPMPDLTTLTLTSGGIPLERNSGLAWCGGSNEFYISNLRIVIESYQWRPPIGRHRVKRDDPFFQEAVPKVFESILLGRYIPWLCAVLKDPHEKRGLFGYYQNLETMLFDLLTESIRQRFAIPTCLKELPLFKQYGNWRKAGYSVNDLEAASHFYYTTQRPELGEFRDLFDDESDEKRAEGAVLDLYGTLYATSFIERRYGSKAEQVTEHFFVADDNTAAGAVVSAMLEELARAHLLGTCRDVRAARFLKLGPGQEPEVSVRAHANKERGRVAVNLNNPDIARMAELAVKGAAEEDRFLGRHFLLREVVLADGLDMPEGRRRQVLQEHCTRHGAPLTGARRGTSALTGEDIARRLKQLGLFDGDPEGRDVSFEKLLVGLLDDDPADAKTESVTL